MNDEILARTFARGHTVAPGVFFGLFLGLGIPGGTVILLLKQGGEVGPHLVLLAQYFPGYSVTWPGSLVGAIYGLGVGFLLGFLLASLRNLVMAAYMHAVRLWSNLFSDRFLDGVDS